MPNRFQPSQLGPYRITALLGRGGMGMVYEGVHEETEEVAALKVLNPGLSDDESFRERFQAEIETLRKLHHPHIVQLFGFGQDHDHLYYVMERIRGKNLQEELSSGRRFDWREVARIAVQVCSALKHAHDHGIIHRDLKPANLLWTEDEQVKLTDFGIAKLFGMARITQGSVLGTADYMAPEQAAGLPVNSRCDLYSLGCVMYTLLVGRPPFTGKSVVEVIQKAQRDPPVPPTQLVKDVPDELNSIILQLLDKDPQRRIPTALSLSHRLQALMHSMSIRPSHSEAMDMLRNAEPRDEGTAEADNVTQRRGPGRPDDPTDVPRGARRKRNPEIEQPTVAMEVDPDGRPVVADSEDLVVITDAATGVSASEPHAGDLMQPALEKLLPADSTAVRKLPASTQYTRVQDVAEPAEGDATASEFQVWTTAAALLALACIVIGFWWYSTRTLTADELFERISAVTETEATRNWTEVSGLMKEFLTQHASDERRSQVAAWSQQLDAERYSRNLELKARRIGSLHLLHPYEQFYLQAVELSDRDLELALDRITALINMAQVQLASLQQQAVQMTDPHNSADSNNGSSSQAAAAPTDSRPRAAEVDPQVLDEIQTVSRCLDAARRKKQQLEKEVQDEAELHRSFIQQRLAEATALEATQPEEARMIRASLRTLYARYAWAADLLPPPP